MIRADLAIWTFALSLAVVAGLRALLFERQRRFLERLPARRHSTIGERDPALTRARRLLVAELGRIVVALFLVAAVVPFLPIDGMAGLATVAFMAVVACAIEAGIAAFQRRAPIIPAILNGVVLMAAAALGLTAGWLVQSWSWGWLVPVAMLGAAATAVADQYESIRLRQRREPRVRITDAAMTNRLTGLAMRCAVAASWWQAAGPSVGDVANARAESDLRGARVVLWPGLEKLLTPEELNAIVAHELGHLYLRHARRRYMHQWLVGTLALGLASLCAAQVWPPQGRSGLLHVAAVAALLPLFYSTGRVWLMAVYRRHEFEADSFACRHDVAGALATALIKLCAANPSLQKTDPWHQCFYDSHPRIQQRLTRLAAR